VIRRLINIEYLVRPCRSSERWIPMPNSSTVLFALSSAFQSSTFLLTVGAIHIMIHRLPQFHVVDPLPHGHAINATLMSTTPFQQQRLYCVSTTFSCTFPDRRLTIQTCVIRLDMCLLHCTVLDDQRIPLGAVTAEDRGTVKREIECSCKFHRRVAQESNLNVV
jgi:hypothetical protein